ncbi:MAG: methionine--tRNA ligase [Planctomycetes bacterium]|nr:methionine--tRNA ligase [Planctomycetota bacterium]MCB9903730.1 methionine--tRNA ligase [Planctomycetota bacterium]
MSRTLVTSALPYANGPIHFGHVAGAYLPADVYVRTLRMQGEEVRFICGTDEYGTAITIDAERVGEPPAEYVKRWHGEIARTFDRFGIEFDIFSGTSTCPYHTEWAQTFFRRLHANGYLQEMTTDQLYSSSQDRFLADRYVVGTCPKCGFENARGDECPSCASSFDALDLLEPRGKLDGKPLERRATKHWYLDLPKLRDDHIGAWFESHEWKPNVRNFVAAMFADLRPRPITRDLDWGVPVPEEIAAGETGKVLYVWFDAPIGYVSMTQELGEQTNEDGAVDRWWRAPETQLVHFIGKDNIPFHALIFPSMLYGMKQDFVLPHAVPANEFYNLQGRKFSTSAGWVVPIEPFFEQYDAEVARFHLIASAPESSDSEFRWEEFQKTANILADTVGNLATRVLRFIDKHFDGAVPPLAEAHRAELDAEILENCGAVVDPAASVREYRFRRASEELLANAAVANVFVDRLAPWTLRKTDPERAMSVLNTCCEWIGWIARWMVPFMPGKAQALWAMIGQPGAVADQAWPGLPQADSWRSLTAGQKLGEVSGLFAKLDDETVAREIAALEERASASA